MRIKALLCAAGLLAAGVATSLAQSNVYSLNVVGYINVPLTNGFNLIANQLDFDGTGTNNTVYTVFGGTGQTSTNLPLGSAALAWDETAGSFVQATLANSGSWLQGVAAVNNGLSPGNGVMVQLKGANGTPTPLTLTLVGNVPQGSSTVNIVGRTFSASNPNGFGVHSFKAPVVGRIETDFGYPANAGDQVLTFNPVSQSYTAQTRGSTTWTAAGEPTNNIAQSFMFKAGATAPATRTWTQNFTVQ